MDREKVAPSYHINFEKNKFGSTLTFFILFSLFVLITLILSLNQQYTLIPIFISIDILFTLFIVNITKVTIKKEEENELLEKHLFTKNSFVIYFTWFVLLYILTYVLYETIIIF